MESIRKDLQKVIIKECETKREVAFDISKFHNGIFIPQLKDKITCTMYYEGDDEGKTETYQNIKELYTYLTERAKISTDLAIDPNEVNVPETEYCDITEQLLLSGHEIAKGILSSETQGLLAFFGTRKMKFSFTGDFGEDTPIISADLRVLTANGKTINEKIVFAASKCYNIAGKPEIMIDVDTDRLGKLFENSEFASLEHLRLSCRLNVCSKTRDENQVAFRYPLELSLINTDPAIFRGVNKYAASIDFGTTSTCVAIKTTEGSELLTIANSNESNSNFENPTNLMVFNWDALYEDWIKNTAPLPVFNKGTSAENKGWLIGKSDKSVCFDFGQNVKNELGNELPEKKTINSILSLLKMIPYKILHDGKKLQLNPFNDDNRFIYIVTSPDLQDEEHFDPVAFYGYLIGRMINDRSKQKNIHTKFQVTSPVKFNDEVKATINRSLLYGLKRTVPKPLQDKVKLEMKYCEPVAFIGAICGTKYLKLDNEDVKFAVYDFGGGTLDFSFGEISSNDEGDTSIDVKMVGGDETIGGESIIERLTFRIYNHNIEKMLAAQIPIEHPRHEKLPDNLDKMLILSSSYTTANTNIINYKISRCLFEGRDVSSSYELSLYDLNGNQKKINVDVDKGKLEDYIKTIIQDTITTFTNEMNAAFDIGSSADARDIHVFLAGNSSKNKYVMPLMKEALPNCNVTRPDDTVAFTPANAPKTAAVRKGRGNSAAAAKAAEENAADNIAAPVAAAAPAVEPPAPEVNVNRLYAITSKTAVALGQLKLNNIEVKMDRESFKLNIGIYNSGKGAFITKLKKGETSNEWVKFKKIIDGTVPIYYSEGAFVNDKYESTPYQEIDGNDGETMYVRMKDQYAIEYCIGDFEDGNIPDDAKIETLDFTKFLS